MPLDSKVILVKTLVLGRLTTEMPSSITLLFISWTGSNEPKIIVFVIY